ncbi:MAG: sugar phosphate isomerase/epimerase [Elusimicrobia bacterium]|nr:sugar phosphate isomerase/epimerase [Elusimicrobiota bacterium]
MKKSVLGAQLYSLRNFMKTPQDIATSLKKVKAIGYDTVQVSGLGPIDPKELKKIVDNEGLKITCTHLNYTRICNETQAVIDEHHLWDCKYIGVGSMPAEYSNKEGFKKFAKEASVVAKKLTDSGLVFIYHNHSFEFEKYDGRTGMDILFEESDPKVFNFEIDTYWVQHGGGDPAAWIKKFKGRMPIVHLKDLVMRGREQLMSEIGEGNLNWPSILKACEDVGVKWYLVEQDICQRDPFESLKISYNNLLKMGFK